jgi:hypothetical protein
MRYKDILNENTQSVPEIIMQEFYKTGYDTPEQCNDGYCGYLADKVVEALGRGEVLTTDEINVGGEFHDSRHEWVFVDGKHYDAETPYGVGRPRDLGYFRRLEDKPMPPTNFEPDLDRLFRDDDVEED